MLLRYGKCPHDHAKVSLDIQRGSIDMVTRSQDMLTYTQDIVNAPWTWQMFQEHHTRLSGHTEMPTRHNRKLSGHGNGIQIHVSMLARHC
jgi:hypothetical protein